MKKYTKQIEFMASICVWRKKRQAFEVVSGLLYCRTIKDAKALAHVWNPKKLSIRRVRLHVHKHKQVIALIPLRFYREGRYIGKCYTQVPDTVSFIHRHCQANGLYLRFG